MRKSQLKQKIMKTLKILKLTLKIAIFLTFLTNLFLTDYHVLKVPSLQYDNSYGLMFLLLHFETFFKLPNQKLHFVMFVLIFLDFLFYLLKVLHSTASLVCPIIINNNLSCLHKNSFLVCYTYITLIYFALFLQLNLHSFYPAVCRIS